MHMTTEQKVRSLIRQVAALPSDAQSEVIQSLIDIHGERLDLYQVDDDERAALARSADDMRLERFASKAAVKQTFARSRGT